MPSTPRTLRTPGATRPARRTLTTAAMVLIAGAILGAIVAVAFPSVIADASISRTYFAVEDTFVDAAAPDASFGVEAALQADAAPSVKRILVRFSVTDIPAGVVPAAAKLRLFVVDRSSEGGAVSLVDGAWSEGATTWASAPAVGAPVASLPRAPSGRWIETDVTSAIRGNGEYAFYVTTRRSDGVDYRAREGGAEAPALVVTWQEPTASPTPSSTGTATPTATATSTPGPAITGTAYYVDAEGGDDANGGTSEGQAWRTLTRAERASLTPGDGLLLKRGSRWSGPFELAASGTEAEPVVVGAYGSGPLPVIEGGGGTCVAVTGSHLFIEHLDVRNCTWAGIEVSGASNTVRNSEISGHAAGIYLKGGATSNRILGNTLRDNNRLSTSDSGAFGVLLHGDANEVAYNSISGSYTPSPAYGTDGAAIEVYGGQSNRIHHNRAIDNKDFVELGNSRSRDNVFSYNVVTSSRPDSNFLVTRGADSGYGPVLGTVAEHNTVYLTGNESEGFVCHAGCDASILHLRNNVIHAVNKAGYADGPVDEDYDLFDGGQVQFVMGPHSRVADPAFADAAALDLHLSTGSPAVDAGIEAWGATDFDGLPVPQDGNGDGSAARDLGAYERPGSGAPTPTPTPTASASPTPTSTAPGGGSTLVVTASADAYVEQGQPDRNFGVAALEADGDPKKDVLLKFEVSGVGTRTVTSARIRLTNIDASGRGGDFYLAGPGWTETGVTWNTAPATAGSLLASLGSVAAGNAYEVDVTAAVSRDGVYSFRVVDPSRDGADYASREMANPPLLVIQLDGGGGTPTPSPTASPTATSTATPTATPSATSTPSPTPTATPGGGAVTASVETAPVGTSGDAADDPAIWVHPTDPAQSLVIGTERASGGGLRVYDLDGNLRQFVSLGSVNNVDVRYGFPLSTGAVDLVTATHSGNDDIVVFRVDPATRTLVDIRASSVPGISGAYGYCMYRSEASGKYYGFASTGGTGTWRQVEFRESSTEPGRVTYAVVRTINHPLDAASGAGSEKMEGCVADDRTGVVYLSEEEYGIHRYGAEPNAGSAFTTVATAASGSLSPDIEGLTVYPVGTSGGYLIASDQGADEFSVFAVPDGAFLGRFQIVAGGVDGVTHTDGIAVTASGLGSAYAQGLFVAQDDSNSGGNQNFKYVSWEQIRQSLGLP